MPNPDAPIEPKPAKAKRKRASTPRAPRVKDAGILAIEREAADKKAQYRLAQQSGSVLKRIIDKMLPKLTQEDRNRLYDTLRHATQATETPALPIGSIAKVRTITLEERGDLKHPKVEISD